MPNFARLKAEEATNTTTSAFQQVATTAILFSFLTIIITGLITLRLNSDNTVTGFKKGDLS